MTIRPPIEGADLQELRSFTTMLLDQASWIEARVDRVEPFDATSFTYSTELLCSLGNVETEGAGDEPAKPTRPLLPLLVVASENQVNFKVQLDATGERLPVLPRDENAPLIARSTILAIVSVCDEVLRAQGNPDQESDLGACVQILRQSITGPRSDRHQCDGVPDGSLLAKAASCLVEQVRELAGAAPQDGMSKLTHLGLVTVTDPESTSSPSTKCQRPPYCSAHPWKTLRDHLMQREKQLEGALAVIDRLLVMMAYNYVVVIRTPASVNGSDQFFISASWTGSEQVLRRPGITWYGKDQGNVSRWLRARRTLGLCEFDYRIWVPNAFNARNYHLQFRAPDGSNLVDGTLAKILGPHGKNHKCKADSMTDIDQLELFSLSSVDVNRWEGKLDENYMSLHHALTDDTMVYGASSDDQSKPVWSTRDFGCWDPAVGLFRLSLPFEGIRAVGFLVGLSTAALLALLAIFYARVERTGSSTLVGLLALAPSLYGTGALVGGSHPLTTRMLSRTRTIIAISALSAASGAVIIALAPPPDIGVLFLSLVAIGAVGCCGLLWFQGRLITHSPPVEEDCECNPPDREGCKRSHTTLAVGRPRFNPMWPCFREKEPDGSGVSTLYVPKKRRTVPLDLKARRLVVEGNKTLRKAIDNYIDRDHHD